MDAPLNVDGISTHPTIVTLSIGPSPGSASTDVGEDEGGVGDRRVEAMLGIILVAETRVWTCGELHSMDVRIMCHNPVSSSRAMIGLTPFSPVQGAPPSFD